MKKNIYFLLILAILLGNIACDVVGGFSDANCYQYKPSDKQFSVCLDGKPTQASKSIQTPWGMLETNMVTHSNRFLSEVVLYTDLPVEALQNSKSADILEKMKDSRIEFIKKESDENISFHTSSVKHTVISGFPALEGKAKFSMRDGENVLNLFGFYRSELVGQRFYEVMVINRDIYPTKYQIQMLMDSFKVNTQAGK